MRVEFLCISVLAPGPRVKLTGCKSALNTPVVYSTDCSKGVVPVLVLLFVALWFILRGDLFFKVLPCVILFLCFSVILALTHVWFALVWFCLFPLNLGVWEGLRVVIVAFHGPFSYLFTTGCSKAVVLGLYVHCVAMWPLCGAFYRALSCSSLVDSVLQYDHLVGEEGAVSLFSLVYVSKSTDRMANSVDPDQTAP